MLLRNVSWDTYERLIAEREERRTPRFFYDRGVLELMSPSGEHDQTSRVVAILVELLAEKIDVDVDNVGSTTFKREDLGRGFEADESFYFSENAARDKGDIVLDDGERITILSLKNGEYTEVPESAFLPGVPKEVLTRLVSSGLNLDLPGWRKLVRESVAGPADRPA